MEALKDLGQIEISSKKEVIWKIPNFYDLPQNYDTIIRSPRFNIDDRDWYMEVYPNGRRLHCSLGWFGIRALNLNCDPHVPVLCYFSILDPEAKYWINREEESNSDGSYCCTRLIPGTLLKFWKDIFVPKGEMYLNFGFNINTLDIDSICLHLRTDDVHRLFQNNFENVCIEASVQAESKKELPMETTVGELDIRSKGVKWKIPNFSDLLQTYNTVTRSPRFQYKDSEWYMEVYPNGRSLYSSLGWFGIAVCNLNSDSTVRCITVSFLEVTYQIDVRLEADSQNKGFYSCPKLLPTSLLKSWQDVIASSGNFHLYFPFDKNDEDDDDTGSLIIIEISTKTMQRWYEWKLVNRDSFIEASTQTEEETVKEELKQTDGGTGTESEKGVEKMRQDFQEILLNGNITDIVLNVKSREFKAHRCILAARSPVFFAMMTHDTKEKITGVVDIPDVDPNAFPDFLNYLYTGSVSNLTSENAVNLYTMANKYQVNELKESCKYLMMATISIDNFCDVFTLSIQHDEKKLKEACIQFFAKNSLDIIVTCKWQTFLSENPITGNELFIKHLQLNK